MRIARRLGGVYGVATTVYRHTCMLQGATSVPSGEKCELTFPYVVFLQVCFEIVVTCLRDCSTPIPAFSPSLLATAVCSVWLQVCFEIVGYLLEELRDSTNLEAFKEDLKDANVFIGSLIFIEELAEKVRSPGHAQLYTSGRG